MEQIRRDEKLCELLVAYEAKSEIIGMMEFVIELKNKAIRSHHSPKTRQLIWVLGRHWRTRLEFNIPTRKSRALKYAGLGLHVVPLHTIADGHCSCASGPDCKHPGKHPRTPKGVKDATIRRKTIKAWWNKWPDANIGIATGARSGIFVLDVDGAVGKASLKVLQAEHEQLPKTVTVETGKGRHLYFRCDGARVGNSVGKLGEGIDVRGDGGYVVGAGSIHVSGSTYTFVDERGPDEIEVAQAPQWLLDLVTAEAQASEAVEVPTIPPEKLDRAKAYVDAALRRELDRLGKAPQHQRNDTLNRTAFKLGQLLPYAILDRQKITDDLARVARSIGLDDSEIRPTIASGLDAGSGSPRRLPFIKSDLCTVEPPAKSKDKITEEPAALGETDTDNGQRFATRFGTNVINTPGRGWLVYDGRRWYPDELLKVRELAKTAARLIADEAAFFKEDNARTARRNFAKQSLSTGALDRMLESGKSLLTVEDSRLDARPLAAQCRKRHHRPTDGTSREARFPRPIDKDWSRSRGSPGKVSVVQEILAAHHRQQQRTPDLHSKVYRLHPYWRHVGAGILLCVRRQRQQRQIDVRKLDPQNAWRLWHPHPDRHFSREAV